MHKGVDLLTKIFTRINQYIFIYFFFFDYSYKQIICRRYLQNSSNLSENASFSTIFIGFIIKNHSMNFDFLDKIKLWEYTWY